MARRLTAGWIAAWANLALVVITIATLFATGVIHFPHTGVPVLSTTRGTGTVPSSLPSDVPLRAGPVVVPGGPTGVTCTSVSGGPTPGLYCLVTFIVRANDPRESFVGLQEAYGPSGPWTDFTVATVHDGTKGFDDDNLTGALDLRAPSVVYIRGFATFDSGEPWLPRSAPTPTVKVDLETNGSLHCQHPHVVKTGSSSAFICDFSGD